MVGEGESMKMMNGKFAPASCRACLILWLQSNPLHRRIVQSVSHWGLTTNSYGACECWSPSSDAGFSSSRPTCTPIRSREPPQPTRRQPNPRAPTQREDPNEKQSACPSPRLPMLVTGAKTALLLVYGPSLYIYISC